MFFVQFVGARRQIAVLGGRIERLGGEIPVRSRREIVLRLAAEIVGTRRLRGRVAAVGRG